MTPFRALPAALAFALCLSVAPARAALFSDVSLGLGLGDDARVFLNVTNDYFAPPPAVAVDVLRRSPSPSDDFPVILLLARASKRPAVEILRLRLDYLSWSDIMFRLNTSPSVLFVGLGRDPGPPYGKAWGRWKKHRRGERFSIRDRDVVELAKLQIAAGSLRVSPYALVSERNKGATIEHFVAEKRRHKYPKAKTAGGQPKGKGPGKQKDPDRGQGQGKPRGRD